MMIRTSRPRCEETDYKKNGKTHYGKQKYRCHRCGRECIQALEREPVAPEPQALVKKLLLERLSWRGICRGVGVSLDGLLTLLVSLYEGLPDHLNVSWEHFENSFLIQRLNI